MNLPSKTLEEAVNAIASLPGIGKKTALRLALFLLKEDRKTANTITESIQKLINNVHNCIICNNLTDLEKCDICSNNFRDHEVICVVEDIKDVIAIENTSQYRGVYHVLGGVISPMEGIGPDKLSINMLTDRLDRTKEIIIALPSTMEGDTTAFYIQKKISHKPIKVTTLARGIPTGGELEFTDEITLGRSILERKEFPSN